MLPSPALLLAGFFFFSRLAFALDTVIDLGYAKYRGKDLENGVMRWSGMRYARSVSRVDGMRFAAPQDPLPERTIINATKFGPVCIGSDSTLKYEFGGHISEDCLFANVFAPKKATNTSLFPVYVFIQGGGFNTNGNANYNGSDLIEAADYEMVVVNFNYRVGPYGFLASREIVANETLSLNNGLKDQRQLLKWVKEHISQFGGDPDHVTIGGASAGGGSVVLQLTAYGGRDDGLFQAAAAESAAFPPLRDVEASQFQYDALLKKSNCSDLPCLTNLNAVQFQQAVKALKVPFPGGSGSPIYFWNPTLDYDFVQDYTINEVKNSKFVKVPTIFGDTTNEGIIFTPDSVSSFSRAHQFVLDQFPKFNWGALRSIWAGPANIVIDARWKQYAASIYGSIRYTCPNLEISAAYVEDGTAPTWQYRWNVGTALHVAELGPIWNNGTSAAGVFIQGYWASFIRSYNPNTYTESFLASKGVNMESPVWETFGEGNGKRMLFADKNSVAIEEVKDQEWERCNALADMGLQLEQKSAAQRTATLTWSPYLVYTIGLLVGFAQWMRPFV